MADKDTENTIERWAQYIIPAVFRAETKILKEHPEWMERLKGVTKENADQVAEEYCRTIATEIVKNKIQNTNDNGTSTDKE